MRRLMLGLAAAMLLAAPAFAGAEMRDRVHADSFGNLVIHSSAGYKRIIVGMGHTADAYIQTGSYYEPDVVYLDENPRRQWRNCTRPPYLWHGRSRMYGLSEGEIPQAPLVCN